MDQSGSFKRSSSRGGRRNKGGWDRRKNAADRRKPKNEPKIPFNKEISESLQQSMAENTRAIREFKRTKTLCARCGKEIENIAEALCDRKTGEPVHFDCVLSLLIEQEPLNPGERIVYIGQGKFAVAKQSDPPGKTFNISRTIEWENETAGPAPWRKEISALFSQVK
ncbi:MAG: hypothetical protein LBR23_00550 [Spirochaetaceae bacterium]|jgi:hypothetical protein|nr:hypothetical protein [Spirochaetaceae bacterium]